eukprot:11057147-Alexandrium_andersonii.AAC.1
MSANPLRKVCKHLRSAYIGHAKQNTALRLVLLHPSLVDLPGFGEGLGEADRHVEKLHALCHEVFARPWFAHGRAFCAVGHCVPPAALAAALE